MLFSLLLVTLLAHAPSPQDPGPGNPTFADAVQAANEGRDADALAAFQRLAAANPHDHQARLWIARLRERMGHPDLAEAVYRSVLLEDPANVEAMLGVGTTSLARGGTGEALELLERAEQLAPQNDRVLAALGRAHRQAGRTSRAVSYLQRATALAPVQQHRRSLEDARRSHLHRVEMRGFAEEYDGRAPNARSGEIVLNLRVADSLRVTGRGQVQRKFGIREERGGAGLEWRWRPATTFRALALVGPDNLVLPEGDYLAAIDHTHGPATWTASIRYFDFTGARVSVVSPAVAWSAADRLSLALRYAVSMTDWGALTGQEAGHSAEINSAYRLHPRLWATVGYARGVEDFERFSIDRIGAFRAHTASGGLRIELPSLTSLVGLYEHQRRHGGIDMGRVTLSLSQRF